MEHADNPGIYSAQATVRSYECGADGLMKPETVLHWFQEIAEAHASALGFGYDFVMSRGLAWVEVRLDAAINRRPGWKETEELRTWTAQETPLLARRNMEIRDGQGNVIITASCLWAVIDVRRRRPVPLNRHIDSLPDTPCGETVAAVFMDTSELQPETREWKAERRDTDFNCHINNAAYLVWALESLPESWMEEHELTGMHLHFRKETHAGESMKSLLFRRDGLTCHRFMQGDELRAEVILEWKSPQGQSEERRVKRGE